MFLQAHCLSRTPTSFQRQLIRRARPAWWLSCAKRVKELDKLTFPGTQAVRLHTIAAKAVCLKEAMEPSFKEYQNQVVVNTKAMAAAVAKHGFRIVTGGTDNHLFLIEVHSRGITGTDAEKALDRAGITVNKNSIPFDPLPPMKGGGIRLGGPRSPPRGCANRRWSRLAVGSRRFFRTSATRSANSVCANKSLNWPRNSRSTTLACAGVPGAHRARPRLAWQPHSVSSISQRPSWQPRESCCAVLEALVAA